MPGETIEVDVENVEFTFTSAVTAELVD